MKVVINKCFGGFGLSQTGYAKYAELAGIKVFFYAPDYSQGVGKNITIRAKPDDDMFYVLKQDIGDKPSNEQLNGKKVEWLHASDLTRSDPNLVQTVETLGKDADTRCSKLEIIEIPDGIEFDIDDYDGMESIHESHRSWG